MQTAGLKSNPIQDLLNNLWLNSNTYSRYCPDGGSELAVVGVFLVGVWAVLPSCAIICRLTRLAVRPVSSRAYA